MDVWSVWRDSDEVGNKSVWCVQLRRKLSELDVVWSDWICKIWGGALSDVWAGLLHLVQAQNVHAAVELAARRSVCSMTRFCPNGSDERQQSGRTRQLDVWAVCVTHIIRKSDSNSDSETIHCLTDAASRCQLVGKWKLLSTCTSTRYQYQLTVTWQRAERSSEYQSRCWLHPACCRWVDQNHSASRKPNPSSPSASETTTTTTTLLFFRIKLKDVHGAKWKTLFQRLEGNLDQI